MSLNVTTTCVVDTRAYRQRQTRPGSGGPGPGLRFLSDCKQSLEELTSVVVSAAADGASRITQHRQNRADDDQHESQNPQDGHFEDETDEQKNDAENDHGELL